MLKRVIYSKVGWRSYLDPTDNTRVQRFLDINGSGVYGELISDIEKSIDEDINEFMVLVHPNASSIVTVNKDDFDDILTHCLQYFTKKEEYELCIVVLRVMDKLKKNHK